MHEEDSDDSENDSELEEPYEFFTKQKRILQMKLILTIKMTQMIIWKIFKYLLDPDIIIDENEKNWK